MSKLLSSKIAKFATGAALVAALFFGGMSTAKALTSAELSAICAVLGCTASQQAALSSLSTTSSTTASTTSASSYVFNTNLKTGMTHADVKELQKALNAMGFTVSTSGAGSAGNETMYFGPATAKAVTAFQNAYASEVLTPAGLTSGTGFFGALSRAKMNSLNASSTTSTTTTPTTTTPTTTTSGSVAVSLASNNPAVSTLVAGQAIADLVHFTFTNSSSTEAKVTNVKLNRTGVSADTTLTNTYLYDGVSRLTDAASVSTSTITFNDPTGLFTVPANGSKTISVRADILTGTSGQTVGISLASFMKTGDTVATASTLAGNIHTIATASLATIDFNATTTPSATTINPQDDYTMFQNVITVGTREVWLKSLRLRQIGSVNTADLANFRLYVDGTMIGSAVAALDSMGYVTFDLSAAPVKLQTGSRTIKMLGNIVGGSNRNFSFSLRQASDAMITDSQYNVEVLATANSTTFSARSTGTQTVDTGSLSIVKQTNSPSGDVVKDASNAVLARFDVKAYGEAMKIENLSFRIDEDDNGNEYTLRNGAIYLDGVQIGSTAAIAGDTDATLAYTNFTFGSSAIITPGTPRVLEVRADIYDNDGTNHVEANDTIQVEIVTGSTNVQRMTSLGYGSYPAATVEGNTLTVKTGTLTVAKDTSYANNTITAPRTAMLIGKFNIQASTSEGSNVTSITVDPTNGSTDAFDASDDLTNMYIKVGSYTSNIKSTVDDDSNVFSTNINVASSQTVAVEVYADVASSATDGDGTADTGTTTIDVAYTTLSSATSTTSGAITGQVITYGTGTFTSAIDGSTPVNRAVSGNQEVTGAAFKFTATNENYTIKEVQVKVGSAAIASTINSVQLYDGATAVGAAVPFAQSTNTAALVTGLNVSVPANTVKTLTAKLMLNTIGTGAGTSQSNAALTLDSVKYADSQGVETTDGTDRAGNEMYVYKAVPTISQVDVVNATVVNGSQVDLFKFTVSAPSASVSSNGITIKQIALPVIWSDTQTADTLEVESLKLLVDGSDLTASDVTLMDEDGNSVESTSGLLEADGTLVISWDTTKELSVAAGQTRTILVRGTFSGFNGSGDTNPTDSVSFGFNTDSSHNGTSVYLNGSSTNAAIWNLHTAAAATGQAANQGRALIWSDVSASPHATDENANSSGDWANSYRIFTDMTAEQFEI